MPQAQEHQTFLLLHDFPCLSGLLSWIKIKKLIIQIILLPPIKINLSSDIRAVSNLQYNIVILAIFA